jgi:hypothetical protein
MHFMNKADVDILRELARQVREIASLPVQEERRRLWKRHNSLRPERAMILLFPEGGWVELITPDQLKCESEETRGIELKLRKKLYHHEHFADDTVIDAEWRVPKAVHSTGWGLESQHHTSDSKRGAWAFQPVLNTEEDLDRLQVPDISHDEHESEHRLEAAQELFGDILDVRLLGIGHVSYHLMQQYTYLRGLEQMMIDMYEQPEFLHRTMRFLVRGHQEVLRQYEDLNLLELNNDGTYHSSGGVGYTDEIPLAGYDPDRIEPNDMWASAESQELASVGPAQHEEFALQYERTLLDPFALNGYGCCEPLTDRLDLVTTVPGIRRLSISPWSDVSVAAEQLGPDYILSWKPKPMHLVGSFDESEIRAYVRNTVELAQKHNAVLEMILKDTHTCEHHPERFDRWSQIAREEVDRAAG